MIWLFDYTIPSLIFLSFFLVFYFFKPVTLTKSNRIFIALVISEAIGFAITFLSCYFDNNSTLFSLPLLYLSNVLYFLFFVGRFLIISLFFATYFNINVKKDIPTILTIIIISCLFLVILLSPYTHCIFDLTASGKYEKGPCFLFIYGGNIITILLDLYYIIRNRQSITSRNLISSLFTIAALTACCLIDFLFFSYLVTDMFFLFAILILFMAFENPDNFIDKRTGLYNLQAFTYLITEYLSYNQKYSVISFSIQNYKDKKHIYGTKQIDLALKEIGRFYQDLSKNKRCFYLQNGKFSIVANSTKKFDYFTKKTLKRFEEPWMINNSELHLNVLIAAMAKDVRFSTLENLAIGFSLAYLDGAKSGNDHITITKESYNRIIRKTLVAKALFKALEENSLIVYYQPIIEAGTRRIIGAEALVRMNDAELGIIPPVEFVTMAEKNGSIEQLGEQVLTKVCKFMKENDISNTGIDWINVNLSPIQCQNKNLSKKIDNIININTIDHKFIHLEITEESMIEASKLQSQMKILISSGYQFSLDDFGSGFSNLSKVKSFPFNNIKLDMSIVKEHFNSPDTMLPSLVKTFKDRGLTVTAEGVETDEMARSLEEMGCNYLQGYYFGKPVSGDDFIKLIKEWPNK